MESFDRRSRGGAQLIKRFLVMALFILVFIALLGALIFLLYRIALLDRRLYSALFTLALAGFLIYLTVKGIKRKKFTKVVLKFLRFFYALLIAAAAIAGVMLYGGLVLRYPVLGAACLPPLVLAFLVLVKKGRLFIRIKNIYHKLN